MSLSTDINFNEIRRQMDWTIADNDAISDALHMAGVQLVGFTVPDEWVTATSVTFQTSLDGTTFFDVYFDGAEYTETVLAGGDLYVAVASPEVFFGAVYLKLRSGTSASPVTQTGGPLTLSAVVRPI